MTEPLYSEIQPVLWIADKGATAPLEGIVIERRWEASGNTEGTQYPPAPRWLYKLQLGPTKETFDIWAAEEHLKPRRP